IDRGGRLTGRLPRQHRVDGKWGAAIALSEDRKVALWERDLASLIRAKAAVFAGIRSLAGALGPGAHQVERAIVSGNFGRFLNLPAALGIGLLPSLPLSRYGYVDNGALEGAALALLSRRFFAEIESYLTKVTYVDLADLPGYMDEFVGASFLPHTSPELLEFRGQAT
ncbi:MAG: ASKHA domain-containing protein, partial [Acidobacteria bacterium]|nr:ASKHA domain-containing protein [Acidobacteriota bacterium]